MTYEKKDIKWIGEGRYKYPYPFWYYAGCAVLTGHLDEPFSSRDLKNLYEDYGLDYEIRTYNYYPHKHSINCGEEGTIQVFVIIGDCVYSGFHDAPSNYLETRKIYKLDRKVFRSTLKKNGWMIKEPKDWSKRKSIKEEIAIQQELDKKVREILAPIKKKRPEKWGELYRASIHKRKSIEQLKEEVKELLKHRS